MAQYFPAPPSSNPNSAQNSEQTSSPLPEPEWQPESALQPAAERTAEPETPTSPSPEPARGPSGSPPVSPLPAQPLSPAEERTWAMLAHLSVLLNLATGFLGTIAALTIYLIYKDRSRYVAYQAMQAFVFQVIWWIGGGLLSAFAWTISGVLVAVFGLGCLLMPFAIIISLAPLVALVYGIIGAIETNQGKDFRYWLVGDWVRGTLTGNP